jgi:hypothetical protein
VPIASERLRLLAELTRELGNLTLELLVRKFWTIRCELEHQEHHAATVAAARDLSSDVCVTNPRMIHR